MCKVCKLLAAIGAINWGLIGVFNYNLVNELLGGLADGMVERVVYIVVGIAGAFVLMGTIQCCMGGTCKKK